MGKITSETQQKQTTATHFSHPHPLNLHSHQPIPNPSPNQSCSACKLDLSGMIYSCTICRFFLHKNCFEMPRKITHPSHKHHVFDLLPLSAYSDGAFNCDACNEAGAGFVYHCKPCGLDLHILCAAAPLSTATAHHPHKLHLRFEAPYADKSFRCDVCGGNGSNHWLYRCDLCGFDVHLKCVTAAAAAPPVAPVGVSVPYPAVGVPAAGSNMAAFGFNRQQSERLAELQAILQRIQNNHAAVQGGTAGFGGGIAGAGAGAGVEGSRLQQQSPFMAAFNNGSFGGGGGGGGGGGLDFLQAFMNGGGGGVPGLNTFGGGGGQEFLQAFMNGGGAGGGFPGLNTFGGGGGQEFLQALMNGGGGGVDALQSLLNGGGGGFDFLNGIGGLF